MKNIIQEPENDLHEKALKYMTRSECQYFYNLLNLSIAFMIDNRKQDGSTYNVYLDQIKSFIKDMNEKYNP